ncbi:hypothetical protein Gotur_021657 [Gossypium turneri]
MRDCERELQLLTVENFCITWTGRAGGKCRIWVVKLMKKKGTSMVLIDSAGAGDIISMAGLGSPSIGHTVANTEVMAALPTVELDPPTISMTFGVNDSPLAGRDGTHLTGGKIGDRLMAESETNLAINVLPGIADTFEVQGRGELQLGILIENMRREGFELSVSPPKVMYKVEKGQKLEPIEEVTIEVNDEHVGLVMEALSHRRAEVADMGPVPGNVGRTRLSLTCPSRGLVGYRSVFSSDTRGTGFMHRAFQCMFFYLLYLFFDKPVELVGLETSGLTSFTTGLVLKTLLATASLQDNVPSLVNPLRDLFPFAAYEKHRGPLGNVRKGVLVSMGYGTITAYALMSLEARGTLFVTPGMETYDGMIVGEHSRDTDLDMTLEEAIGYVASDELIEVTPKAIRLRKRYLDVNKRKAMSKKAKN